MISQDSINEVMSRADIVDVVGQFVRLKRRGTNFLANCPFHNEKTPSFNVSQAKGIYKCFGCGKAGNVVTFLQEHEKLTYPEAIHWLADYYKIKIDETERSPEQQQQQQLGESLRLLNEYATNWFHNCMINTEEGQLIGLSYFKQRGFRNEIIERFRLGYNPEQADVFYRDSIKKGYQADLLEKAGLIKNRNGIYHDAYRGRVIFPIQSMTGRILGFGARILKSTEKAPKYVNTPENEIYIKHKVLYGMYQSRQAIAKQDECFLVEGYTDVISLHQGGVENVVASSGTSLTEDQLRLIGQLTKNLTILYDGDAAGVKAALRGLDMALSQSFNVQLVLLTDGEDPDSFIQKHGSSRFHEYVKAHKQNVISFRLQVGLSEVGDDPVKKSKLVNEIAESISRINKAEDFALQAHFIREAARKLDVDEAGLITLVNKNIRERIEKDKDQVRISERQKSRDAGIAEIGPTHPDDSHPPELEARQVPGQPPGVQITPDEEQEWQLLRVLVEHGHEQYDDNQTVANHIEQTIDPDFLEDKTVGALYAEYFKHKARFGDVPETHYFINHPDSAVRNRMANLLHPRQEISSRWKEKYGIESLTGAMVYVNDVDSTLAYFQVKKLIHLKEDAMKKLSVEADPVTQKVYEEHIMNLIGMQRELMKQHATVVLKLSKRK